MTTKNTPGRERARQLVEEARAGRGISQEALAGEAGISTKTYYNFLQGSWPLARALRGLERALGFTPMVLDDVADHMWGVLRPADDNGTTTRGGDNEAAPPPGEVAGREPRRSRDWPQQAPAARRGMAGGAPHTLPVHHPVAIPGASFTGARPAYPATATFSHVLFVPIQAPMSAAGIRLSGTLAAAATPLAGVVSPDGVDGSRDEFHVAHIYTPSRSTQVVDHEVSLNVSEVRHPCRTVGASHALHAVQGEGELAVATVVHGASPQNAPVWSRRTASGQPLLNGQDEDAGDMTDSGRLQANPSLLAQVSGSGLGVCW